MKKIIILCLFVLLVGCSKQAKGLTNYQDLDLILEKRSDGKYKEAVVYDLRNGTVCDDGHIKGFTCIFYQSKITVDDVFDNINIVYSKNALVLLICEDGLTSAALAKKLSDAGYKKVYYYIGGYQEYLIQNEDFIPEVGCDC